MTLERTRSVLLTVVASVLCGLGMSCRHSLSPRTPLRLPLGMTLSQCEAVYGRPINVTKGGYGYSFDVGPDYHLFVLMDTGRVTEAWVFDLTCEDSSNLVTRTLAAVGEDQQWFEIPSNETNAARWLRHDRRVYARHRSGDSWLEFFSWPGSIHNEGDRWADACIQFRSLPDVYYPSVWNRTLSLTAAFLLVELNEPSLAEDAKNVLNHVYRFVLLPSFHGIAVVRLDLQPRGSAVVQTKQTDGTPCNIRLGTVFVSETQTLSSARVAGFLDVLDKNSFWQIPPSVPREEYPRGGTYWFLEGVRDGRHHVAIRYDPRGGPFTQIVSHLLDMSPMRTVEEHRLQSAARRSPDWQEPWPGFGDFDPFDMGEYAPESPNNPLERDE